MKTTDSRERLKALMRKHTENSVASASSPVPTAAVQSPPVAPAMTGISSLAQAAPPEKAKASWDRVTIRLTAGEIQKVNDLVIATQQATRLSKITTTDILRVALRRVGEKETIIPAEIEALRAVDGRTSKVIVRRV